MSFSTLIFQSLRVEYLRITLDQILGVYSCCKQRLTVICKLGHLSVQPCRSRLYCSIIEPVLMYGAICFFRMLTVTDKNKLLKINLLVGKIVLLIYQTMSLQAL